MAYNNPFLDDSELFGTADSKTSTTVGSLPNASAPQRPTNGAKSTNMNDIFVSRVFLRHSRVTIEE
jgi:hypothetical protein